MTLRIPIPKEEIWSFLAFALVAMLTGFTIIFSILLMLFDSPLGTLEGGIPYWVALVICAGIEAEMFFLIRHRTRKELNR